jgi:transposase
VASTLLIIAGDNPQRLDCEKSFASLCGSSPLDASSGKQQRHRLNRGGDRQANAALWRVVMVRGTVNGGRNVRAGGTHRTGRETSETVGYLAQTRTICD